MEQIVTPRLLLRPPQLTDAEAVHTAMTRVWSELQLWMSWAYDGHETREAVETFLKAGMNSLGKDGVLLGFDRQTGDFVLSSGLHAAGDTPDEYETGYWVAHDYLRRGYATEATNAIIRYAFYARQAKAMRINYFADNEKSRRVIEKLGFTYVETREKVHKRCSNGEMLDSHEFIMTDPAVLSPLDVEWG